MTCDLNCDLGDTAPAIGPGTEELIALVSSVNIACGIHAGDPSSVLELVRLAAQYPVAIGAHPGLPDRDGDGRRERPVSPDEVYALVLYQIGAINPFVRAQGRRLRHVKPHGALYNMAARQRPLADAIAAAVRTFDPSLTLVGLSGSELLTAATAVGLGSASEAFADRTYEPDGSLTSRTIAGATIADEEIAAAQVRRMVTEGLVRTRAAGDIPVRADTICVHGDGPHAVSFARRLRSMLADARIDVKAPA